MKKEQKEMRMLYFFGIMMVVMSHCGIAGVTLLNKWIPFSSCQLAIFAFGAGYFYMNNQKKTTKEIILQKVKKIVLPFFIWNFIYGILATMLKENLGFTYFKPLTFETFFVTSIYSGHQYMLNLGSWFLVPLYLLYMSHIPFLKILKKNENRIYLIVLCSLLVGMLGVSLAMKGYYTKWWLFLVRFLYFLPFFSFGMFYKLKLEKKDTFSHKMYFGTLFFLLVGILLWKGKVPSYPASTCQNFDSPFLPFLVGLIGILFWLRISKILVPILEKSKIIQTIASNTFGIMMHHLTGFFILNCCFSLVSKLHILPSFNQLKFHQDVWYVYFPKSLSQLYVFYLIAGILFSLFMVWLEKKVKQRCKKIKEKYFE